MKWLKTDLPMKDCPFCGHAPSIGVEQVWDRGITQDVLTVGCQNDCFIKPRYSLTVLDVDAALIEMVEAWNLRKDARYWRDVQKRMHASSSVA